MERLPLELMVNIVQRCSTEPDQLVRLVRVSKRFREIIYTTPLFWKRIKFKRLNLKLAQELLRNLQVKTHVQTLDLTECRIDITTLKMLLKYLPNVQTLCLERSPLITLEELAHCLKDLPLVLKDLSVDQCGFEKLPQDFWQFENKVLVQQLEELLAVLQSQAPDCLLSPSICDDCAQCVAYSCEQDCVVCSQLICDMVCWNCDHKRYRICTSNQRFNSYCGFSHCHLDCLKDEDLCDNCGAWRCQFCKQKSAASCAGCRGVLQ